MIVLLIIILNFVWILGLNFEQILINFSNDDSFYYYTIAKNFWNYGSFTFDGLNTTNGFQPLWEIVLIPIFGISDHYVPIYVSKLVEIILASSAVWMMYKIVGKLFNNQIAILSIIIFLTSSAIFKDSIRGMEVAINTFFFILCLKLFIDILNSEYNRNKLLVFGLISGLCCLARVDNLIYIGVISVFLLFKLKLKNILAFLIPLIIILIPYYVINLIFFESFLPISGKVKMLLSQEKFLSLNGFDYLLAKLKDGFWFINLKGEMATIISVVFFGMLAFFVFNRKRKESHNIILLLLGIACLIKILVYSFTMSYPISATSIYYTEEKVLYCILVAITIKFIFDYCYKYFKKLKSKASLSTIKTKDFVTLFMTLFIAITIIHKIFLYTNQINKMTNDWEYNSYQGAFYLNNNLPSESIISSSDAGVIGYFSNFKCVNLDGLVNNQHFYNTLKENKLEKYIIDSKIDNFINYYPCKDEFPYLTERFKSILIPQNIPHIGNDDWCIRLWKINRNQL